MPPRAGQKEEGRARIMSSAARGFRRAGYGGLGVDGIARDAGGTSGAFYAHFPSKAAAFRAVVVAGMAELRDGIDALRRTAGERWRAAFIDFYLGERRTCDLGDSCALQALSSDVARADIAVRQDYEAELRRIIDLAADGMGAAPADERRRDAIALLAILSGGVAMARAVHDPQLSEEIAVAVRAVATRLGTGGDA